MGKTIKENNYRRKKNGDVKNEAKVKQCVSEKCKQNQRNIKNTNVCKLLHANIWSGFRASMPQ